MPGRLHRVVGVLARPNSHRARSSCIGRAPERRPAASAQEDALARSGTPPEHPARGTSSCQGRSPGSRVSTSVSAFPVRGTSDPR
ncbi:hypothetical protein F8B43_0965 [Methylorubrum populi]|uniref:Uncharacterized protein n=1 Tax=Methylorubrum populi TaxID=223967 RepID=A0A833J867_9HYPH|nr:hypothetical protein F8B43_0965 [Methylorubrum populi]